MAINQLIRGNIGSIANVGIPLGLLLLVVALSLGIAARKEPSGKATIIASAIILASLIIFVPVSRVIRSGGGPPGESMYMIAPDQVGEPHSRVAIRLPLSYRRSPSLNRPAAAATTARSARTTAVNRIGSNSLNTRAGM